MREDVSGDGGRELFWLTYDYDDGDGAGLSKWSMYETYELIEGDGSGDGQEAFGVNARNGDGAALWVGNDDYTYKFFTFGDEREEF